MNCMTEVRDEKIPSERAMRHVRAYCNEVSWQPDKVYGRTLSTRERVMYYLLRLVRPLWHPLKRLGEAYRMTKEVGPTVEEKTGVSKGRQFIQQIALYLQHAVRPKDYYQYRLYQDDMRHQADKFIYHHQMDVLMNALAEDISAGDAEILQDKVRFWRHCREHELATIPIYAVVDSHTVEWVDAPSGDSLPPHNLFSKPADWGQGLGIKMWEHIEDATYLGEDGTHVKGGALLKSLKEQSFKIDRRIILQPHLKNASKIEALVQSDALCSARIITIRKPDGKAELLIARAGLPAGNGGGSNFSGGALGAPVDGETGELGKARFKRLSKVMELYEKHPSSGRRIEGFRLPDWNEAVNLAIAAHESFRRIAFVGWDIAFTKDGPVLIEGNVGFGSTSPQVTHGKPLGKSQLPIYHLWHTMVKSGDAKNRVRV